MTNLMNTITYLEFMNSCTFTSWSNFLKVFFSAYILKKNTVTFCSIQQKQEREEKKCSHLKCYYRQSYFKALQFPVPIKWKSS